MLNKFYTNQDFNLKRNNFIFEEDDSPPLSDIQMNVNGRKVTYRFRGKAEK
jgi:hypothetical protein